MKSILLRLIILALILSAPAYFIYKDYSKQVAPEVKTPEATATTTSSVTVKADSNAVKVLPTPAKNVTKDILRGTLPDLTKKWTIPDSFSADAKIIINKRINDLTTSLQADNEQYDKWIELGNTRKLVGDYSEAKTIWEFAAKVWTDGLVSYNNLGDLYANYLKDGAKAETNMLKVIEIDSHYISGYVSLAGLYTQLHGEGDSKVLAILNKGLTNNPQSVDLMIAIATNYKDTGDKVNAKKYYDMALVRAKELNNQSLQDRLGAEINNL